uniref:helix-turn-helix domain-containing protein n=1 Tax=Chitinilyticum aquatile TaxID=362520 RepID=UPI0009D6569B
MASLYHHLSPEEGACIMQMFAQGHSLRQIARVTHRAPSSLSRELRRNTATCPVPLD